MIQKPGDDATILDELDADERSGRQRGRKRVEPISTSKVPLRFFFCLTDDPPEEFARAVET